MKKYILLLTTLVILNLMLINVVTMKQKDPSYKNNTKEGNGKVRMKLMQNNVKSKRGLKSIIQPSNDFVGSKLSFEITPQNILHQIMQNCTDTRYKVPNVVHYIWFGCKREFNFYHYLSIMSVLHNMRPCAVVVHADCEPNNYWWNELISKRFDNFYLVHQEAPNKIFNHTISRVEHKSDVVRLEILIRWGGIYFDDTVLAIKSFNQLRNYSVVFPFQEKGILNNGVIISEKNSTFLQTLYHESYTHYKKSAWAYNSCRYPWMLWKKHPQLDLHVEMKSFQPPWNKWREVFYGNYEWKDKYAIHLYTKQIKRKINYPEAIFTMNSTFGEISRLTLYQNT
uniref:uncharacterized protein LOC113474623 n=1 Tax=Ciona intestinalis TaxID=7719 RepID=UPI000EF4F6A7|nr:uncharacterized protein LOC113474623 [Ciona intestinalis]|eukprot:XP_026692243.1 uncharacterized protein LOC113474623 [Ciona intestinalis]